MSAPIMSETLSCRFLNYKIGLSIIEKEKDATNAVSITTAKVAKEFDPNTRMTGATWSRSIC